ncbi:RNA methyltransferase, partial [Staphylococcus argenteus]|nr:RNA methyltransferase [Staphylococcus argenteus]
GPRLVGLGEQTQNRTNQPQTVRFCVCSPARASAVAPASS